MIRDLRSVIAGAISDWKAYDVPAVCRRVGLADGEEQEAYSSKYKYALKRIQELPAEEVVVVGHRLAAETEDFRLQELLAKIDEIGEPIVTGLTRQRIIGAFQGRALSTEIEEIDLIRAVWPIASMTPPEGSFKANLEDHILQHAMWNSDMTQRGLLEALGLLNCSRSQLFKFLARVTEPDAQTPAAQASLVTSINQHLAHDGFRLVEIERVSGSPRYEVRPTPAGSPADQPISDALHAFDPQDVGPRWAAAMNSRETEPGRAIALARTLLEDVCKWILTESNAGYAEADDLPVLYRRLSKVLKLAPDDHTEQIFKQILGSCASIVEALGALRNKLSEAHSLGPKRARPLPRHADLAVNLSGSMAAFLVATWQARREQEQAA